VSNKWLGERPSEGERLGHVLDHPATDTTKTMMQETMVAAGRVGAIGGRHLRAGCSSRASERDRTRARYQRGGWRASETSKKDGQSKRCSSSPARARARVYIISRFI